MRILLTNDDGITSRGLLAAKQALDEVGEVSVIAPDSNRSAVGRGITIDRAADRDRGRAARRLARIRDRRHARSTACASPSSASLGERPDLIVAGINYGVNLGDDVTYSGTVAAAFEGIVLGIPAIAVSQQSKEAGLHFRQQRDYDFSPAAGILPTLVRHVVERGLPPGTILNVNAPPPPVKGVEVARLGRRIYRDRLELESDEAGRRRYRIYGDDPSYHDEPDTDFRAIAEGKIAVTPVHLDLTSAGALEEIARWHARVTPGLARPGRSSGSASAACASRPTRPRRGVALETIAAAAEAGVTVFDTARAYGGQRAAPGPRPAPAREPSRARGS